MANNGLGDIVLNMLLLAKEKDDSKEALAYLEDMSKRKSDSLRLGKVFGYSIAEYAIATLKWINTEKSINCYNDLFSVLSSDEQQSVNEIVSRQLYLEV